jgi:hypothetical protein
MPPPPPPHLRTERANARLAGIGEGRCHPQPQPLLPAPTRLIKFVANARRAWLACTPLLPSRFVAMRYPAYTHPLDPELHGLVLDLSTPQPPVRQSIVWAAIPPHTRHIFFVVMQTYPWSESRANEADQTGVAPHIPPRQNPRWSQHQTAGPAAASSSSAPAAVLQAAQRLLGNVSTIVPWHNHAQDMHNQGSSQL